jgi:hypothetical protein
VDAAVRLENIQIISDGDLRSAELPGQISDQDAAVAIQYLQDQSASLFV